MDEKYLTHYNIPDSRQEPLDCGLNTAK
jgi:hypothetical protein